MTYDGPKKIVILGGGIAGLAAMDAITAALARATGPLPADLSVTLVEAEAVTGGRAGSRPLDAAAHADHPAAPWGTHTPHGLHFVWGSYQHLLRLMEGAGPPLSPPIGTSTYCAWMAPPDLPGDARAPARVVAVHVCDPAHPEQAWHPRAERVLRAFARRGAAVDAFEVALKALLGLDVEVEALLSYMDIVFDEDNLGTELRWILFLFGALSGALGDAERSQLLRDVLGGRAPADVDIGELMQPLFDLQIAPRLRRIATLGSMDTVRTLADAGFGAASMITDAFRTALSGTPVVGPAAERLDHAARDLHALSDFLFQLKRDSQAIVLKLASYDPRQSGYLKNILKAAFSSPYGLDVGTSMRDAQFGVRKYEGAVLQLFDGDDARGVWEGVAARIEARVAVGLPQGALIRGRFVSRLVLDGGAVKRVELAATASRPAPEVPTVRPAQPGPVTETLDADLVISTLVPAVLAKVLEPDVASSTGAAALVRSADELGRFMNETINLQLFFPERHELPFVEPPTGHAETPPFGISNLEGPFTIVVDLRRGWSRPRFEAIALAEADLGTPFTGTAWELTGAYADLFTFDRHAHPGRFQWPIAAQQQLIELLHDPDDIDPGTVDDRPWIHDAGAPGRPPPPVMGEVKPGSAAAYRDRWRTQATPIIVGWTLRQLASMPGLAARTRNYLEDESEKILSGAPTQVRWVLTRNGQAENRFFSAEPGLYGLRPHARFQTEVRGLWAAGDWTRNGLNLQAMEAATISGLQAAYAVLEQLRVGGITGIVPPRIDPDCMPPGAWDVGLPA